ncbi:MAG: DNA polymerase III subunit delta' [Pseudomonadota bacterium]
MTALVGNAAAQAAFLDAIDGRAIHHAWLIAGAEGIGKMAFARRAALRLLAEASDPGALPPTLDVPTGHRIASLFAAGSHPDYRELRRLPKDPDKPDQDIARSIKIDQVRTLMPMLATKPALHGRRVIVVDAIDDLERNAANALLKSLEEPPAGTIFLLVSHAPGRLLPTIRSRCRLLRFDPLSDAEVADVLRDALPEADAGEIAALVRAGAGSPGRALRFAGLDLDTIEAALSAIARDGDVDNQQRLKLAKMLGGKPAQARYEAFLERAPAFIAERARSKTGTALRDALDAYDAARSLARMSLANSLVAETTAFEMGGLVARLADGPRTH